MQRAAESFKENGTRVQVKIKFGLESRTIFSDFKEWQQELKDIWTDNIKLNFSKFGSKIYEQNIIRGLYCNCCTRLLKISVTCPFKLERMQQKVRGRSKLRS